MKPANSQNHDDQGFEIRSPDAARMLILTETARSMGVRFYMKKRSCRTVVLVCGQSTARKIVQRAMKMALEYGHRKGKVIAQVLLEHGVFPHKEVMEVLEADSVDLERCAVSGFALN